MDAVEADYEELEIEWPCSLRELEKSLQIVGNRPLYEAAKEHPIDAWRIWALSHPREYTEQSEEFAEHLRCFKRNAEIVREGLAEDPNAGIGLNNLADELPWDERRRNITPGAFD
ncbi:g6500 [Coccomyxa viridis]|uniref:G6500 protein n=1 Tax=Coccomyxa viridis TaxID=1274662 RepID=A0ABP1G0E7_9CHLO